MSDDVLDPGNTAVVGKMKKCLVPGSLYYSNRRV